MAAPAVAPQRSPRPELELHGSDMEGVLFAGTRGLEGQSPPRAQT